MTWKNVTYQDCDSKNEMLKSKVQPYDEIHNAFLKCILYVKILLLIFKDVGLDILSNT